MAWLSWNSIVLHVLVFYPNTEMGMTSILFTKYRVIPKSLRNFCTAEFGNPGGTYELPCIIRVVESR
jgi:hypothetical protein